MNVNDIRVYRTETLGYRRLNRQNYDTVHLTVFVVENKSRVLHFVWVEMITHINTDCNEQRQLLLSL
jgi:hypothetical protein